MRKITIVFFFLMTITLLACGGTNSEMPSLPREEPGPSYDRVVRNLITEYSTNLELNPRNIKNWKEYGDVCYMNGWYEEAATAYNYAASNGLPQCKMRLAYCERELGDVNACITASSYLKRAIDPEAAITLAAWHLEDGDLDSTSKWINESGLGYSERRSIVEVRMYLQKGEGPKARQALEPLLQKRPRPIVLQLIQEVGRFNQDEALINGYPSPSYFEKTLPDEPFILAISGLARTPEADIKRASWIRRNLPRQEALPKIKAMLKDRPDDPTLVTMTAEILLSLGVPRRAKMELDSIRDQEPTMPGYWSIDSAVLHALSKSSDNPKPLLEDAVASGVKAIKINPEFDGGHIGLAMACEGLQLFDRAAQSWSRASQLAANDQRSKQLKVNALRCRSLAGETDEAAEKLLSLLKNQNEPTDTLLLECALACKRALRKEDLQAVLKRMSPDTLAIYSQRTN